MRCWLEVRVEVPAALVEALSDLLFELGSSGLELNETTSACSVCAYFQAQDPQPLLAAIDEFLSRNNVLPNKVHWQFINEENWADSWKQWCVPLPVGETLWVRPPWSNGAPPGRVDLIIEPGMAFGTGHHPSTAGCLVLLEQVVRRQHIRRALDLGTGSGILAIALAKLGVPTVEAVDNDPLALEAARRNVQVNGVGHAVQVSASWLPKTNHYDLVVANLYLSVLEELAVDIAASLGATGHFVCAGFYTKDIPALAQAYGRYGLSIYQDWESEPWVALWFHKATP